MENITPSHLEPRCAIYSTTSTPSPRELFEKYQWVVHRLWRRYFSTLLEMKQDLLQEGFLALWNAARQYNPQKGKFSGYAMSAVRRGMQWYVNRQAKGIYIPEHKARRIYDIRKFEHYFRGKHQRNPGCDEIARFFDMPTVKIDTLLTLRLQKTETLDEPIDDDHRETRCDTIRDERFLPSTERVDAELLLKRIMKVIADDVPGNTERNSKIFMMRMGLTRLGAEMSLSEVGKELGVTRERIRQLEKTMMDSIREKIAS